VSVSRPWLFLDCDGVVCPLPHPDAAVRELRAVPAGYRSWPDAFWGVYVHELLCGWAIELDATYSVIWTTDWEHNVQGLVAKPAGLPTWPVLELHRRAAPRGRVAHKASAIAALLAEDPRPFAWVDDHLPSTPPMQLPSLDLEHLLLRPNPQRGLTRQLVEKLLSFAAALS
jgi:hypothetical protein